MRFRCLLAALLLFGASRSSSRADDQPADPLLPAKIPGYELRTLDVSKPVLFNVNGSWVQASLPVFFYYPVSTPAQAAALLRQALDELRALGRKPEWTAEELQGVIARVDAAMRIMEPPVPAREDDPKR